LKSLLRFLPVLYLALTVLPAQSGSGTAPDAPSTVSVTHTAAADLSKSEVAPLVPVPLPQKHTKTLAEMDDRDFFVLNFLHLIPHPVFGGHGPEGETFATFYNNNLFQVFAVALMLVVFTLVKKSFAGGSPSGFVRVFRGWCHWLRDEVIYSVMGKEDGRAWAPYFLYVFFFVAFMNLMGLIPVWGVTATASYYVTGTLAMTTFFCMLFFGMRKQGVVGYFRNLLPHDLPIALLPLMAVVELVGMFIKPFALMVRLFANMLGGHMVVYAFLGMIFLFAKMMGGNVFLSTLTAIPAFGMSVFIMIIEGFISLLQAYVFTYLSVIFVHQAMHPAH
jgi:F-type H+-transporting ATPase subunit a